MNEQHDGRRDQPVTGADLYNVAVQLDSNFASFRSESLNLRIEMASEFKAVRAEMKEGFAMMNLRFAELSRENSRTSWRATGTTIVSLIALLGIDRFWR